MNCLSILLWIAGFNLFYAKPIENIAMAKEVGYHITQKLFPNEDYSGKKVCVQFIEEDAHQGMYLIDYLPIEMDDTIPNKKWIRDSVCLDDGIVPKVFIDKETGKIIAWGNTLSTIALKRGLFSNLGI